MSGLAALLAGRKPVGVYHWSSPMRSGDIRHCAEHARWDCVVLDTIQATDADGFHEAVASAFTLPEGYGRDFDALTAVLAAESDSTNKPTLVVWEGWAPLAKADETTARRVVDVFADRAGRSPSFAVILHGSGPDLDFAELDPH
jgi:RNAse (barnase) inhibitor barstar